MEYQIIKNFLPPELCKRMSDYMWQRYKDEKYYFDIQCKISPAFMNPFRNPQKVYKEKLENILGISLWDTYNNARLYFKGEILEPHKDKDQCEIGSSITLGYSGNKPWPFFLYSHEKHKMIKVDLDIGDVLIYKGFELLHWRNPLEDEWQTQAFWFYNTNDRHRDPLFPGIEDMQKTYEFMV